MGVLEYDAFQFSAAGMNETVGMSKNGCLPVLTSTITPNSREVRMFINVNATLSDPNLVKIDTSHCVALPIAG
jgi:hypothetical protein